MDIKLEIAKVIGQATNEDVTEIRDKVETPKNNAMGDYAFPCFKYAKELKKAPPVIAQEILSNMGKSPYIDSASTVGGYINFFVNREEYAKSVLLDVAEQKEAYGNSDIGKGSIVTVDYSSPNIAKPFHVGHLRSTAIGRALYNLYECLGYKCIGINHLGDWGTQFGKLIVAYKKWGNRKAVDEGGIPELNRLYIKFHEEAANDEGLNDEARLWFVKMERGDTEALSEWQWIYDLSMKEFQRVYDLLGVTFDAFTGESFYNDKMDAVLEDLEQKGLVKESQGALIVDLEDEGMSPCLVKRADGGTLYATRDLATAIYRKNHYGFAKSLYVTALDQALHFAQVFAVLKKAGYEWADNLYHIPFGLVSLSTGKISTRTGNVVLMEDLLNEAIEKTSQVINEKNSSLKNKEQVAKSVGIGAVIFNDLFNGRIKDVVFSWDRILNFDGETGPYVQYTHARSCSLLKRSGFNEDFSSIDYSAIDDDYSFDVIKTLYRLQDAILESCNKFEPYVLSRYLIDLTQEFNKFYNNNYILNEEENVKQARLAIVYAVKTVLKKGLQVLGIDAPEEM